MTIQTLLDAWIISGGFHSINSPATEADIQAVEATIGTPFPSSLCELYSLLNGGWTLDRVFYPLHPTDDEEIALTNANEKYIEWGWTIPQEIRLFADEGAEHAFGIWLAKTANPIYSPPILEFGAPSNQDAWMGIASTNLLSFLYSWAILQLVDKEGAVANTALNMLKVPQSLRVDHFDETQFDKQHSWDERHFTQIRKWADPQLPDPYGTSYTQGYTIGDLKRIFGESK